MGPKAFEDAKELCFFEILDISILHGWVVSPLDVQAFPVVGHHSTSSLTETLSKFEAARQRLTSGGDGGGGEDGLGDILADIKAIDEGLVIRDFLDRSSSQLTYEGLIQLHTKMHDRELAVFFRTRRFDTILRHQDELYMLCNENKFQGTDIVW